MNTLANEPLSWRQIETRMDERIHFRLLFRNASEQEVQTRLAGAGCLRTTYSAASDILYFVTSEGRSRLDSERIKRKAALQQVFAKSGWQRFQRFGPASQN